MTREEKIAELSAIHIIVANPVVTYDMGMQFDVLTGVGAWTDLGNVGQWPYMHFPISDGLRNLQKRLLREVVSDEDMMQDDICKELCMYHDMWSGSYQLESEALSEALAVIRKELAAINLDGKDLYVYADLEDGNRDIRLFASYEELCNSVLTDWEDSVRPYAEMSDEEIDHWYDVAEVNDWAGILYSDFTEDGEDISRMP